MGNQEEKKGKESVVGSMGGIANLRLRIDSIEEDVSQFKKSASGKAPGEIAVGNMTGSGAFVFRIVVNNINDFLQNFQYLELRLDPSESPASGADENKK